MNIAATYQIKIKFFVSLLVVVLAAIAGLTLPSYGVEAADNDFSNGITVDSTGDASDANVGNGICDDGAGNCTLRAAIEESNISAGVQTINFNITGVADFSLGGQNGYSIKINSPLAINQQVVIDGYSQLGSLANSTISPNPFDGRLLIEIDGENMPTGTFNYSCVTVTSSNASGTTLQGLVINDCGTNGIFLYDTDNVNIFGNYIGVDPTGLIDRGNGRDFTSFSVADGVFAIAAQNTSIGGSNPQERNIIAGNQAGDIFLGDENEVDASQGNIIQGNYIGIGADGLTPLPSGYNFGLGNAILIGHSFNDQVGGFNSGQGNVIGSSLEYGVSFRDGSAGATVKGNYIGTDYTGNATTAYSLTTGIGTFEGSGHISTGVHIGAVSPLFTRPVHDITVGGEEPGAGNVISGNSYTNNLSFDTRGIIIHDGAYNVSVKGNYVGVGADGITSLPNEGNGIEVLEESADLPVDNILIGGTSSSAANIIANNGGLGVWVYGLNGNHADGVSVIGNSIFNNEYLGIDLEAFGNTANDSEDADSGANGILNYPVGRTVTESGSDTIVSYQLDVPAGDYRVEFFSNVSADPSGFGEGQIYLGYQDITSSGGTGVQNYTKVLTGVTGVTNLSMTTTQRNLPTQSGFGATSEFGPTALIGPVIDVAMTIGLVSNTNIAKGDSVVHNLTVTNNGPDPLNLTALDNSIPGSNHLLINLLPPDLEYVGESSPDVTCLEIGVVSSTGFSAALPNHQDYNILLCGWTGSPRYLLAGESIVIPIKTTVSQDSDLNWVNYGIVGSVLEDPDIATIGTAFSSGQDFLDLLGESVNNISISRYPLPEEQVSNISNGNDSSVSLAETGMFIVLGIVFGGVLISASLRLRKKSSYSVVS